MTIDWSAMQTAEARARAEAAAARAEARARAQAYLAATDWYVIRAADTGEPMPDAVRARRTEARQLLSAG